MTSSQAPATCLALALLATPAAAVSGSFPGAAEHQAFRVEGARYLMGTLCRGQVWHATEEKARRALEEAFDRLARAEARLSTWREDSELSSLNAAAGQGLRPISPELADFLAWSRRLARETGGAFDPSVGALLDAWDLRGEGRRPSPRALRRALRDTDWRRIALAHDPPRAGLERRDLWLDAGAAGKGWALDRARETLQAHGVHAALLDLGGQLLALGAPPGQGAWRVGVADPRRRQRSLMEVELRDASLATSAAGGRLLCDAEGCLGHVLDPRTGRPVPPGGSVTVLASLAVEADALSTALLVLGPEAGADLIENHPGRAALWLRPENPQRPDGNLTAVMAGPSVWSQRQDAGQKKERTANP